MNWPCEKDIRLFIINEVNPRDLRELYSDLEKVGSSKAKKIKIEAQDIKAN